MTIVNKKKDGTWSRMTSNAETVPCRGIGIKGDGSTIQHNTAQAKSTHSQLQCPSHTADHLGPYPYARPAMDGLDAFIARPLPHVRRTLHSVQLHRQCPMDGRACTMVVVSVDQGSIPKRVQGASNLGKSPTLEEGILEQELLD